MILAKAFLNFIFSPLAEANGNERVLKKNTLPLDKPPFFVYICRVLGHKIDIRLVTREHTVTQVFTIKIFRALFNDMR